MKILTGLICILLLLYCCLAQTPRGHYNPTPQDRDTNPDRILATQRVDPVQVKKDADELAQLANAVPAEVTQAANGLVSKDLKDKLKRIEKLSKRLRSELLLD